MEAKNKRLQVQSHNPKDRAIASRANVSIFQDSSVGRMATNDGTPESQQLGEAEADDPLCPPPPSYLSEKHSEWIFRPKDRKRKLKENNTKCHEIQIC